MSDASDVSTDHGTDRDTTAAGTGISERTHVIQAAGADRDTGSVGAIIGEIYVSCAGDSTADRQDTRTRIFNRVVAIENECSANIIRRIISARNENTVFCTIAS